MVLTENLLEYLHVKKIEMASEINIAQDGMKAYVVIFPLIESKEQKYKTNLMPIESYEIRIIKHKNIYTDEEYGFDYDYALDDVTTRVKRIFVERTDDNYKLEEVLSSLVTIEFKRLENFDSALVNSPIECYLESPEERPHLWIDDIFK